MHLCQDVSANVRVAALDSLTQCLCLVKQLSRLDGNIFPEYILPTISSLAVDPVTIVRITLAQNISTLAEISVKFLEQTQISNSIDGMVLNYETELHDLHEMFSGTVMSLLTDSQVIVKQTLLESGINKLCVFFGSQKGEQFFFCFKIIKYLGMKYLPFQQMT